MGDSGPIRGLRARYTSAGCNRVSNAASWGSRFVAFGAHNSVTIYDPAQTKVVATLPGHTDRVNAVRWVSPRHAFPFLGQLDPPPCQLLVSGSSDQSVRVWRLDSACGTRWRHLATLRGHDGSVTALEALLLSDGTLLLVSIGADGSVLMWASALASARAQVHPCELSAPPHDPGTAAPSAPSDGPSDPPPPWVCVQRLHVGTRSMQAVTAVELPLLLPPGLTSQLPPATVVPSHPIVLLALSGLDHAIHLLSNVTAAGGGGGALGTSASGGGGVPGASGQPSSTTFPSHACNGPVESSGAALGRFVELCRLRGHQDWVRALAFSIPMLGRAGQASPCVGPDGLPPHASSAGQGAARYAGTVGQGDAGHAGAQGGAGAGITATVASQGNADNAGNDGRQRWGVDSRQRWDILLASGSQDRSVRVWRISSVPALGATHVEATAGTSGGHSTSNGGRYTAAAPAAPASASSRLLQHARGASFAIRGAPFVAHFESLLVGHEDWVTGVAWQPPQAPPLRRPAPASRETRTGPAAHGSAGGRAWRGDGPGTAGATGSINHGGEESDLSHDHSLVLATSSSLQQPLCLLSASMDRTMMMWRPDAHAGGLWVARVCMGDAGGSPLGYLGGIFRPDGRAVLAHGLTGALHVWERMPPVVERMPAVGERTPAGGEREVVGEERELACMNGSGDGVAEEHGGGDGGDGTARVAAPWRRVGEGEEKLERLGAAGSHVTLIPGGGRAPANGVCESLEGERAGGVTHGGREGVRDNEGEAGEQGEAGGGQPSARGVVADTSGFAQQDGARVEGGREEEEEEEKGVDDLDGATWHEIARPQVHGHDINCLAFVPLDSSASASGSNDASPLPPGGVPRRVVYVSGAEEKVSRVFEAPGPFLATLANVTGATGVSAVGAPALEGSRAASGDGAEGGGGVPGGGMGGDVSGKARGAGSGAVSALPLGAGLPALGLSNKPLYASSRGSGTAHAGGDDDYGIDDDDGGAATRKMLGFNDFDTGPAPCPGVLRQPPLEEGLSIHTLWPETHKLYGHGNEVFAMAASNGGALLATACRAQSASIAEVWLWCTATWRPLAQLRAHALTVTQMAFSPDDRYLLTASRDRTFALFARGAAAQPGDAGYQLAWHQAKAHDRIVWSVSWLGDGSIMYAHDAIMDASRSSQRRQGLGGAGGQEGVGTDGGSMALENNALSPAALPHVFVTGSRDKKVKVWCVREHDRRHAHSSQHAKAAITVTVSLLHALPLFEAGVTAVAFAPVLAPFVGPALARRIMGGDERKSLGKATSQSCSTQEGAVAGSGDAPGGTGAGKSMDADRPANLEHATPPVQERAAAGQVAPLTLAVGLENGAVELWSMEGKWEACARDDVVAEGGADAVCHELVGVSKCSRLTSAGLFDRHGDAVNRLRWRHVPSRGAPKMSSRGGAGKGGEDASAGDLPQRVRLQLASCGADHMVRLYDMVF
eukprot:jgi/Mesvir1/7677/Mv11647-RA.1